MTEKKTENIFNYGVFSIAPKKLERVLPHEVPVYGTSSDGKVLPGASVGVLKSVHLNHGVVRGWTGKAYAFCRGKLSGGAITMQEATPMLRQAEDLLMAALENPQKTFLILEDEASKVFAEEEVAAFYTVAKRLSAEVGPKTLHGYLNIAWPDSYIKMLHAAYQRELDD